MSRALAAFTLASTLLACAALAGCSGLHFPGVYRIDIEQGNIVTEEMLGKLRPGLTEDQVRYVLGSPQRVDPFEPGRWVYLYQLRRGNGERIDNRLVLWLENGALVRWEGSALPDSARRRLNTPAGDATPATTAAPAGTY